MVLRKPIQNLTTIRIPDRVLLLLRPNSIFDQLFLDYSSQIRDAHHDNSGSTWFPDDF